MARIPSPETTEDFIYRLKSKEREIEDPVQLIRFEDFVEATAPLHSMDVIVIRDGNKAPDVEFKTFEHDRQVNIAQIKFTFWDSTNTHDHRSYVLSVILRYLA